MKTIVHLGLCAIVSAAVLLLPAHRAHACGGLVQADTGVVNQDGQLAIVSFHDDVTDVVLTLDVPDATNAFGVLVPVPSEPVIDAQPVSSDALAALEEATRPVIFVDNGGGTSSGCGCGSDALGANDRGGVVIGDAVAIGPVTAQWVSGTTGDAVGDWLAQEGFALPAGGQAVVDDYVGRGMSFIAFKRNETATGAARIGVHFTLDGDQRAYALKMTRLGAGAEMAFTLFIGAARATGADTPYASLRIADLDANLAATDYADAVRVAVAERGGKAFVVETATAAEDLAGLGLGDILPAGTIVTRLSTVTDPALLDADVTFTSAAPENLGKQPVVAGVTTSSFLPPPRVDLSLSLLFAALLLVVVVRQPRPWRSRLHATI